MSHPNPKSGLVRCTVDIPEEEAAALDAFAARTERNRAQALRLAVRLLIQQASQSDPDNPLAA